MGAERAGQRWVLSGAKVGAERSGQRWVLSGAKMSAERGGEGGCRTRQGWLPKVVGVSTERAARQR